jgi:hypothetical protein
VHGGPLLRLLVEGGDATASKLSVQGKLTGCNCPFVSYKVSKLVNLLRKQAQARQLRRTARQARLLVFSLLY